MSNAAAPTPWPGPWRRRSARCGVDDRRALRARATRSTGTRARPRSSSAPRPARCSAAMLACGLSVRDADQPPARHRRARRPGDRLRPGHGERRHAAAAPAAPDRLGVACSRKSVLHPRRVPVLAALAGLAPRGRGTLAAVGDLVTQVNPDGKWPEHPAGLDDRDGLRHRQAGGVRIAGGAGVEPCRCRDGVVLDSRAGSRRWRSAAAATSTAARCRRPRSTCSPVVGSTRSSCSRR